jgi:hypothetical protein
MNIDQLPFFVYGAAHTHPSIYTQYGLYNPVSNCFALVHNDLSLLSIISKLFSGRYTLILCKLDCADNFEINLIDNLVCLNWTIANVNDSSFTAFSSLDQPAYNVQKLVPTLRVLDTIDLLVQDQPYLHYALTWVDDLSPDKDYSVMFRGNNLAEIIDLPFDTPPNYRAQLRKEVYKIIYTTFNFDEATVKIEALRTKYDFSNLNLRIHGT